DPMPSELVVDVAAVSINRGELRLLAARPEGWRPGQDVAGIVREAAADGSGPSPGTRVVAWVDQSGWAERVCAPANRVAVLAEGVSFGAAATLPIAGMTALRALRVGGELLGRRVLVTGAAGGVGRFAVELAARGGASVTAVARDAARAEGLDLLGADRIVFDIGEAEGPFDVILESVGGASLAGAVRLVAPQGAVVVFGNSSGEAAEISFGDFVGRPGARLEGFFVYLSAQPPGFGADLQRLADMVARGKLNPHVGLEVSWTEATTAFAAVAERHVNGKAVLLVD
ncbi:MAG: zinc-binding dehydrogenase, partial [Acidimicrobiia bacterium]